uniref:solute carrier family 22 member 5-like n=1 Tax=Styela clava TaxID=7725 RepID=UPI001939F5C6|nr:solute carrier family 22 member 5-like [Styela clava]
MKLEDYLSQVGSFGLYHKRIYAITFIAAIPNIFFTLHFLFANFQLDFRCDSSHHLNGLLQNITSEHNFAIVNSTANLEQNVTGLNQCYTPLLATSDGNKTNSNASTIFVKCQNKWIFDLKPYQKSAVTEVWSKTPFRLFMCITNTRKCHGSDILELRYLHHFCVDRGSWNDYKLLHLFCYRLFPESARWLLKKGRMQDAKKELETIAKLNGTKANYQQILKDNVIELDSTIHQMKTTGLIETARILLRSRIRWRFFTCFYGWFVTCMVYYGIILHSTRFSKDRFLNCFIAGIVELPAYSAAFFAIKYIGRPRTFSFCMFLCGFSCSLLPFMPENSSLTTAVAILSKAGVTTAFFAIYTISSEISPTLQRSSLLGMGSGLGRIGSCLAPFLMFMGKFYHFLPNITMGALAIFCGVITLIFIPETKGQPMPDTVEEALNNTRIYGWRICRSLAPQIEDVTTNANKKVHEV